jgi:hypothetical protein
MLGVAVESKIGVLLTLSDMGRLPILGWFFTLLAHNCRFLITYGLFTLATYLQVTLLMQGRSANPGLVISAACSLVLELILNVVEYPPVALTKETWVKVTLGQPIDVDWVCVGMLLIGCLSLDWGVKTFWFDGIPPSPQSINSSAARARHKRREDIKKRKEEQSKQPSPANEQPTQPTQPVNTQ